MENIGLFISWLAPLGIMLDMVGIGYMVKSSNRADKRAQRFAPDNLDELQAEEKIWTTRGLHFVFLGFGLQLVAALANNT